MSAKVFRPRVRLARSVAEQASRKSGGRVLVRLAEVRTERWQLDTQSPAARSLVQESFLLTLRVEGKHGVGSAEESLAASELEHPGRERKGLVAAAIAAAREGRGGSLEGALADASVLEPEDRFSSKLGCWDVLGAVADGARSKRNADVSLDVRFDAERLVFATAQNAVARSSFAVTATGDVHIETAQGFASAPCGVAGEDSTILERAAAAGREAASSAAKRATLVGLDGATGPVYLSPEVVAWTLQTPILDGFAAAKEGARADFPKWMEVDDASSRELDEQGVLGKSRPLVRAGKWLRGPFRPFDGTGRTRRNPKTGEPEAALAAPSFRGSGELLSSTKDLLAKAEIALLQIASADPLPGGGVHLVAHGARKEAKRWRPTGLLGLRLSGNELARNTKGVSRQREAIVVSNSPFQVPGVVLERVRVHEVGA